uniref:endonuclease/exonuclease/phosphatase family protein n=1 Tax=Acetatifactor sp. TaxID=1872090 RepID=UPI004057AF0E
MKILSLNMNMFNFDTSDNFYDYLEEIDPDIAIIQECRYNRLRENYSKYKVLFPENFTEKNVDSRIHFTLMLCKNRSSKREDAKFKNRFDYKNLKMISDQCSIFAVHLPYREKNVEVEFDKMLTTILESNAMMICGDFNASAKKPNENYQFLLDLIKYHNYVNLWEEGIKSEKASVIDYRGNRKLAEDKVYRTYSGNTHIDYMLGKKGQVELESIIIDFRTLAFTDHCSIIAEVEV